jgi:hypothetical protein
MLGLLGYAVRLLATAIGDMHAQHPAATIDTWPTWARDERGSGVLPGGDAQLAESFNVRFCHRDRPRCAGDLLLLRRHRSRRPGQHLRRAADRAADLHRPGRLRRQRGVVRLPLQRGFDSVEVATAAASHTAEGRLVCDEP